MTIARKLILAFFCIALTPTVLADKVKKVEVVNTPTVIAEITNEQPVEIAGAVDVNGIVEVSITNTPTVNVASMPDIGAGLSPYQVELVGSEGEIFQNSIGSSFLCYFDVPAGKMLRIEQVSGVISLGNVRRIALITDFDGDGNIDSGYFVPKLLKLGAPLYQTTYEVQAQFYVRDTNIYGDQEGNLRDIRVVVSTDGQTDGGFPGFNSCTVVGRLYPDPF